MADIRRKYRKQTHVSAGAGLAGCAELFAEDSGYRKNWSMYNSGQYDESWPSSRALQSTQSICMEQISLILS